MRVTWPSSRRASAGLPSLKARGLQTRRVEILGLVAGDDAAGEAADAGKVARAGDVALLRLRAGRAQESKASRKTNGMVPDRRMVAPLW